MGNHPCGFDPTAVSGGDRAVGLVQKPRRNDLEF